MTERLGWPESRCALGYQSRMGPTEWLKPDLETVLNELAAAGERRVLVCPISFAVDCLETLEEIPIRARETFAAQGGELHLCPALNADERFINALHKLVTRGPQSITEWKSSTPLITARPKGGSPRLRPRRAGAAERDDAQPRGHRPRPAARL